MDWEPPSCKMARDGVRGVPGRKERAGGELPERSHCQRLWRRDKVQNNQIRTCKHNTMYTFSDILAYKQKRIIGALVKENGRGQ